MKDKPLQTQTDELIRLLFQNPNIKELLNGNPFPNLKNWYLGAGAVCQTVWNHLSGYEITKGIKDYDLVYCNLEDICKQSETKEQQRLRKQFSHLPIELDVANEARVHTWFEEYSGVKINQLKSCEEAINYWPTTATAIGINKIKDKINVYAPYGLDDLFKMIVRPNKSSVARWMYEEKIKRWKIKWPKLKMIPWE